MNTRVWANLVLAAAVVCMPGCKKKQATPADPNTDQKTKEVAELLRTSPEAIYTKVERGQLPGVIRDGRRLLFHRDNLLQWLEERRAPSAEEIRR